MEVFLHIISNNIIPIFILIFLGYILNKKFELDIHTLSKLNFYIYVPLFVIVNLYTTEIPIEMAKVLFFVVFLLLLNMLVANLVSRIRGHDVGIKSAFSNSIIFYNSANVGLPLITLVFSSGPYLIGGETPYLNLAITVQITVMLVQNITTNTLGCFNAGRANLHWKESMGKIFKMPVIYAIPTAFLLKAAPFDLTTTPLWPALEYVRSGMISIALIILGIQLSKTKFQVNNKDVYLSTIMRLLGGPIIALLLIKLMGFQGIIAQTLMISASVPTAVNTALIAVEYDNHPDFCSQIVMTSTVLSTITLSLVIYMARIVFSVV